MARRRIIGRLSRPEARALGSWRAYAAARGDATRKLRWAAQKVRSAPMARAFARWREVGAARAARSRRGSAAATRWAHPGASPNPNPNTLTLTLTLALALALTLT